MLVEIPLLQLMFKHICKVLAAPSDDGQWWPKHVKANFYILILNLLHLMDLTAHSCINPLKTEFLLNNIYKSSLYLTGNTLRLHYKGKPINVVWGNSRCLL
jgi:hypothetical protein